MCTPAALNNRYLSVLVDNLGLDAHPLDPDNPPAGIVIHHRGLKFHLANSAPGDPEYLRITCHLALTDHHPDNIAAAAYHLNHRYKAIKIQPLDESAVLASEQFVAPADALPHPTHLIAVLPRTLHALHHAYDAFTTDLAFRTITAGMAIDPDPCDDTHPQP